MQEMIAVSRSVVDHWRLWWGPGPLPPRASALGVVMREGREPRVGVLIRLASGKLVQGNAGAIRNLPQAATEQALARATG